MVCLVRVWGRELGMRSVGERKYRSPLYYLDTLVNPDTCLGIVLEKKPNWFYLRWSRLLTYWSTGAQSIKYWD